MNEWPELPDAAWQDTRDTLHLWTQIVGKIRLAQMPWLNHSWHVALYVSARGLTTSPIPHRERAFQIDFDFIDHVLWVRTSDGHFRQLVLAPMPVAQFYSELFATMAALELDVRITTMPSEIADCIPFDRDRTHASYDRDYATRFWRVLLASHNMTEVERLCDRVIMMKKGRIEDDDAPERLLARYGRETLEEVFLDIARGRGEAREAAQ